MCKGLIGKKLGMTGIFSPDGRQIPVTVLQVGPCVITQIKTMATDGYNALQLAFGLKKKTRVNKALAGHFAKSGNEVYAHIIEFSVDNPSEFSLGQAIPLDIFTIGDIVDVSGVTIGRGFSGVMRRHGFAGGRKTHGSHCKRIPGSIGCSAWPSRVVKGKKLPGQYGNVQKTVKNMMIVDIRPEDHVILVKGAVPGAEAGIVTIKKTKTIQPAKIQ
jgi:large subunit ribosomal protein L3